MFCRVSGSIPDLYPLNTSSSSTYLWQAKMSTDNAKCLMVGEVDVKLSSVENHLLWTNISKKGGGANLFYYVLNLLYFSLQYLLLTVSILPLCLYHPTRCRHHVSRNESLTMYPNEHPERFMAFHLCFRINQ